MTFSTEPDFPRIGEPTTSRYHVVCTRDGAAVRRTSTGDHMASAPSIQAAVRIAAALDNLDRTEDLA